MTHGCNRWYYYPAWSEKPDAERMIPEGSLIFGFDES
jgi:hypothetical protein